MVSMYAECGCFSSAKNAFGELSHPNVVAWTLWSPSLFRSDDAVGAGNVFADMPVRNITYWNLMLAGYTKAVEFGEAQRLFMEMETQGSSFLEHHDRRLFQSLPF
ncbi:hypothetical protein KSP40_PGU007828 [Platanthera guangdongensis]|uniref:Pentatricopeptide repeat-containing protein n=1 Tax=Platanthera guangdongensis TaxID=2320717 RepID=A0ABR2MY97_9ASPA